MRNRLRSGINAVARRLGHEIVPYRTRPMKKLALYERVVPDATYAPWKGDEAFQAIHRAVRAHTLVDGYRCWELWTLVQQTAKLKGSILEIGVWRGGTGAILAKKAALLGIQDPVFLCDTFQGVVKAGKNDTYYSGGEHADTSRAVVEDLIKGFRLDNVRILEGTFPDQTAARIPATEARFRLCHVDVDVYESAKQVMDWVWPRLEVGGVVVFDDYGFVECEGIRHYVDEHTDEPDRIVLHNLNGHAIMVKLK